MQGRTDLANYNFDGTQVPSLAEDNYVLTYSNSTGEISLQAASAGGINISDDASPTLGGNLDVDTYSIVSSAGLDIAITPHTTGSIVLDGLSWPQADGTADYDYRVAIFDELICQRLQKGYQNTKRHR